MKHLWLHWKDNKTGKEGWYEDIWSKYPENEDFPEDLPYWWAEGNMSCDGNRAQTFLGEDDDPHLCGDDRFDILEWEWRDVD